jgi:hypothetical protein
MTNHISNDEKVNRVFGVLSQEPRPRLSMRELAHATSLSLSQAYEGWRALRQILSDHVAVMEPHGAATVYYLSDEFQPGAEYLYWQTRHIYTRVNSARASVRDLERAADLVPAVTGALEDTADNFGGVRANLRQALRFLGAQIGVPDEEIARVLAA